MDPTQPVVVATSPAAGMGGVDPDTALTVTFDKHMDPATISGSTIYLVTQTGTTVPTSTNYNGFTVQLTPLWQLEYASVYTIVVSTETADVAGNHLEHEYRCTFTTKPAPIPPAEIYTGDATDVTENGARLTGVFVNRTGETTDTWFEFWHGTETALSTAPEIYAAAGEITVSAALAGLIERTTYSYRLVTRNSMGVFLGETRTFTTHASVCVLIDNLDAPAGLRTDGMHLYWTEIYGNAVKRFHTATGSVEQIASVMIGGNSSSITIDDAHIYWSDERTIWRSEFDGVSLVVFSSDALGDIREIYAHINGLYVRHDQFISLISPDGSTVTQLFQRDPYSGFDGSMVSDGNYLYWSDYFKGLVQRMPLAGGPVTTLSVGLDYPLDILLVGGTLFVSTSEHIVTLSASGGPISATYNVSGSMAVDDFHLYVATGNTISRVYLTSGQIETLASGQSAWSKPVVDAEAIYWLSSGTRYYPPLGSLNMISKQ